MLLGFAAVLLALNLCGLLLSFWCGVILGPPWFINFGIVGFIVSWFCMLFLIISRGQRGSGEPWPGLSRHVPALQHFRRSLEVLFVFLISGVILGFAGLIFTARLDGVCASPDRPLLKERATYELNNHGRHTQVSRLRFVVVGTSFFVAWHGGAALPSALALYYVLFGELPAWLRNRLGI
jgi:predicted secreted protein